ncbi:MAG: PIN domain-containing protein [Ardenticatenaceae bacterium]|nr:PIN domain-containing protein [Ardenticatenaceae bacterium]
MNGASDLQFVDTNILIYAHDRSAGVKHLQAKTLLQELWNTHTGCLSVQVMQEFYVNVTRKVARPLSPEAAAQIIADLAVWDVHRPAVEDILDAIGVQARYQLSFWDAMIVVSAQQLGCRTLWSEDLNSGQVYDGVTVRNPFQLDG